MSYVRWNSTPRGAYDSDVYIYEDVSGGITCCGCDFNTDDTEMMVTHVQTEHTEKGEAVPDFVIPRIRKRGQRE